MRPEWRWKEYAWKSSRKKKDFYFLDSEELYFAKTDNHPIYASSRTHDEVIELFLTKRKAYENFVFASVKGDYGEAITPFFQYAVLIDAPKDIRIKRVKNRSFQKFGNRMLPGGDLYEQEQRFFDFVQSREEDTVERWVQSLTCPILRVDGTKPVEENANLIVRQIQNRPAI